VKEHYGEQEKTPGGHEALCVAALLTVEIIKLFVSRRLYLELMNKTPKLLNPPFKRLNRIVTAYFFLFLIFLGGCQKSDPDQTDPPPPPTPLGSVPVDSVRLVFVGSRNSKKLLALNGIDGALKWSASVGESVVSSPAYSKGKVFVAAGNKLFAFDTLGLLKWSTNLQGYVGHRSPIVVDDVVYVCSEGGAFSVNANTGTVNWRLDGLYNGFPPIYRNNVLYLNSATGLCAIDAMSGTKKWEVTSTTSIPPVVFDDRLYVADDRVFFGQSFKVINPANGAELWYVPKAFGGENPQRLMGLTVKNGRVYGFRE
jgi:outer membrane protein assembly factor BamB